jgi:hypothetical protein
LVRSARIAVKESIAARTRYVALTPKLSTESPVATMLNGGAA